MSALSVQLSELEMLQSMFSSSELRLGSTVDDIKATLEGRQSTYPLVSFTLNLDVEIKMEVSVTLPADYPAVEPEIFVRGESMDKQQQACINRDLHEFVTNLERGEVCVYSAISWLQENAHRFQQEVDCSTQDTVEDKMVRLWIYSHHIYNKDKRRNILAYASQHSCSGFILPGRPGIICLEGFEHDCDEVWKKIRNMTWQKIMLKTREYCENRSFPTFEEKSFIKCKNERHMDMGEFFKYLESHNCGYIFKEYFGFDGKVSGQEDT